jgi:hypothetical protein
LSVSPRAAFANSERSNRAINSGGEEPARGLVRIEWVEFAQATDNKQIEIAKRIVILTAGLILLNCANRAAASSAGRP